MQGEPVVDEKQVFPPVFLTFFLSSVAVGFPQRPGTESGEETGVDQQRYSQGGRQSQVTVDEVKWQVEFVSF